LRERARARLVAEQLERGGARPTKVIPAAAAAPRELGVLGQEAVARVERIAAPARAASSMPSMSR
jgi:hypothetical protein